MITAEVSGKRIAIEADYRENERIKLCPGATWNRQTRLWEVPLSWASCQAMRGVFGEVLQIGPELTGWATQERARVDVCMDLREAPDADIGADPVDARLYPLQRVGVKFLVEADSALLADPMGGGKTVQTIRALERMAALGGDDECYPVLIVCPSSMKWTWRDEFAQWAPSRTVEVVSGTAAARRKQIASGADVIVINYEAMAKHARLAGYGYIRLTEEEKKERELNAVGFATVVADEAHRIKNAMAKQTRAVWYLGDRARHRYALTGTPIANVPDDLWAIMRFVAPQEFPSKTAYLNRYVEQAWSPFGFSQSVGLNAATKDEFFRIVYPRMIRRPKNLLVPGLPAKLPPIVREVELEAKQRTAYNDMRKNMLAQLDGGILTATNPLMKVLRLVQLASASAEFDPADPDGKPILCKPSCKVNALLEISEEAGDDSLVVFASSVQLLRLCAAALDAAGVSWGAITGDVVGEARHQVVQEFQAGQKRIVLCSYGAGSEGLTLTRASTVVRLQRSWSSVQNAQAEDRVHRPGQTEEVTIIDVLAKDTIESRIAAVADNKLARLEELVQDERMLKEWLAK